ncbi:nucleotide-binding universal stress UspA family protein [Luteibacter jiangsuensis]|uniref:Nucleotide-binding universal stress UspA family protein n=1 Tax=Luteibacter jiangsuensis TaxID=637577 RepID=A0ABT9SU23_9GAMM|nr:universal stress protein [Luteibacter jiangsuensis]MDQ0008290.1 nucleotide-binding universal stress UspA family protein [Luteibacter jiangsuensis]
MDTKPSLPYRLLLRPGLIDGEVPVELVPSNQAAQLLCPTCAKTLPRSGMSSRCATPFTRILIATDGSALGNDATALGVSLARLAAVPVVFLHAAMPWRGGRWLARLFANAEVSVDPGCAALAECNLDRARVLAMNAGVRFETRLAYDPHPDRAILQCVADTGCDLIVMGSRSGHLSRRVSARATVPLLTCQNGWGREAAHAAI